MIAGPHITIVWFKVGSNEVVYYSHVAGPRNHIESTQPGPLIYPLRLYYLHHVIVMLTETYDRYT